MYCTCNGKNALKKYAFVMCMYFSFEKGDVFTVLNEMGDQWLWVKSQATGDHGQIHEVLVEDLVSFFYDRERESRRGREQQGGRERETVGMGEKGESQGERQGESRRGREKRGRMRETEGEWEGDRGRKERVGKGQRERRVGE